MLGQVVRVFKNFLRLTKKEEPFSKWNIWDITAVFKLGDMEPSVDIESAEDSVAIEKEKPKNDISMVTCCNRQCVLCFASFAVLLANIVAILMILNDLYVIERETDSYNEISSRQKSTSRINICMKLKPNSFRDMYPDGSLQCYPDVQFIRILIEMMVLAYGRQLMPHSNIPSIAKQTVNQGYVAGGSIVDPKNKECSKVATETRFKNMISQCEKERNSLNFSRNGIYMVHVQLEFRSLERCPSQPTTIRLRSNTGETLIKHTVFHKEGLLVAQPKSYLTFVRLKNHDSLHLQISDTSSLESDWKSNVIGGVLFS